MVFPCFHAVFTSTAAAASREAYRRFLPGGPSGARGADAPRGVRGPVLPEVGSGGAARWPSEQVRRLSAHQRGPPGAARRRHQEQHERVRGAQQDRLSPCDRWGRG